MVNMKSHRILSLFQALFLLCICVIIGNTVALSLDSLHSSRESEDNSFKTALDNIHYRRRMAEKRRQPIQYESRFSKKDSHRWRDPEEDETGRRYSQRYAGNKYATSLSRKVERFLSEIGDEDNKDVRKKKKEDDNHHEEDLKLEGSFVEDSAEKRSDKRSYDADSGGPSRIFAHKSSPVSDGIQERTESSDNEPEENDQESSVGRMKKEGSNAINYSRDNEHYSRFWDPERRGGNIFRRKEMHNTRGEPATFQSAKRRYSKRRSYRNHPLINSHTNIKRSKDTKDQILGELKEILKDENNEKRDVKKRENDKNEKPAAEEKVDNSSDVHGEEISTENAFDESSKSGKDEDKFNEWLRDEYFKTMAMTMATMKKKRGTWTPLVTPDVDEKIVPRQQLNFVEDLEDEKSQKFQAIEDKLESIESAMLSDALQLIREGAEGRESSEAYGEQVLNKLYAANDIQKMREALEHLRRTMAHMTQYQDEEDEEGIEDNDNINSWPGLAPMKRDEENLAKALGVMAPNQSKRRYSVPNDGEPYIPRVSMRSLPSFAPEDSSSGQLISVYNPLSEDTSDTDTTDGSECPALDLLSSDCSVLGDVVPGGPLKRLVLEACNWHEVCYSCGSGFGLNSDECDVGFVEQSRTICQDDIPCQTTARMMLMPLRQRRVFFKRSVPAICYRDPCVERFLQQG